VLSNDLLQTVRKCTQAIVIKDQCIGKVVTGGVERSFKKTQIQLLCRIG